MSTQEIRLEQLFRACDSKGSGYLDLQDLRDLCSGFGISTTDADTLFADLDRDGDGKISFEDFSTGFRDFFTPDNDDPVKESRRASLVGLEEQVFADSGLMDKTRARRGRLKRAPSMEEWKDFLDGINLKATQVFSANKLQELQTALRFTPSSPQLLSCFQDVVKSLMSDVQRIQTENDRLEQIYIKERESHEKQMRHIEEELDAQVQKMEAKIKVQIREEVEVERKSLKEKMDAEMNELQSHLQLFQSFEKLLGKDRGDDERLRQMQYKLDEASQENRQLRLSLTDTQTNMVVLNSEIKQLKNQYQDRCRELNSEKESLMDYFQEQDNLMRQLNMLHEANQRLQDMNDSLRDTMANNLNSLGSQPNSLEENRLVVKRGSVIGDYLQDDVSAPITQINTDVINLRKRAKPPSNSPSPTDLHYGEAKSRVLALPSSDYEQRNLALCFGVQRIEDFDSGVSTMRDGEFDSPYAVSTPVDHEDLKITEISSKSSSPEGNVEFEFYKETYPEEESSDMSRSDRWLENIREETEEELAGLKSFGSNCSGSEDITHRSTEIPTPNNPKTAYEKRMRFANMGDNQTMSSLSKPLTILEPTGLPDRMYKIVFAGDAAVGKSSFILRVCKGVFVPTISSTLGVDFHVRTLRVDEKNVTLQLWDTAGQERFRSITKSYFRRADGVLLLYDCTSERSFVNVRDWMQSIDEVAEKRLPIILCANKMDIRDSLQKEGKSVVTTENGEKLAREYGAIFLETSAKNGHNIIETVVQLTREMLSTEDVEVRTSGLRITDVNKKSGSCCKKS